MPLYNVFLQEFIARKKLKIHPSIMMLMGTSLSSNPTSPVPDARPCLDHQSDGLSPVLPQSPPCWATQAWCDLAQAEAELHCLQERHATETESMKQGVERAILGAHREEKRLLERVEQDHRDTRQHLEQVQRENMAAARVSQSLLEQKFHKLAQLRQQIQEVGQQVWSGLDESGPNPNLLLKEVAEFLQPWEISVSLKRVNFKPSPQPNAIAFGDICVQEQSLCLHARGFGLRGQLCAIHSREMHEDTDHQSTGGEKNTIGQGSTSSTGRVVRKIRLSTQNDLESEEECSSTQMCLWLQKCEQSKIESTSFQQQGEDITLTVPTVLKNMNTEDKEQVYKMISNGKHYSPRNRRPLLTAVSGRMPPTSSERRWEYALSLDSQDGDNGKVSQDSKSRLLRYGNGVLTSPRMTLRETPLTSQSCQSLTSRSQLHSRLSHSSDEHSLGTHGDSGRAPSPTDSLDSNYTFIVSPSHDYNVSRGSLNYNCHLSKSAVDLTHKTRPLIKGGTNEQVGVWRLKCGNFKSSSTLTSPTHGRGLWVSDMGLQKEKKIQMAGSEKHLVASSSSMSAIDDSSKEPKRGRGEKRESALVELDEEGDQSMAVFNPRLVHLMRQFGKHGSGRADLTLPSGIHATSQGQLFIVDCGNARVQVCVILNIFYAHTKYSMCTISNVIDSNV